MFLGMVIRMKITFTKKEIAFLHDVLHGYMPRDEFEGHWKALQFKFDRLAEKYVLGGEDGTHPGGCTCEGAEETCQAKETKEEGSGTDQTGNSLT
jgi:hypothetical protein